MPFLPLAGNSPLPSPGPQFLPFYAASAPVTYRLFSAVSGPAAATSYSGDFLAGLNFTVTQGGCWFYGYWWWCAATNQSTSGVKCALWSVSPTSEGGSGNVLVPGSVVTSGTLTAGQWNYIPLSTPLQLAPGYVAGMSGGTAAGSCYCAAVGVNGNFPDLGNWWGTNAPDGLTAGPLYAFGGTAGSYAPPYSQPQGCFSTAGSDPSLTMPASTSGTDNFCVDVQISTTVPAGYSGSYRIYPNKFDTNADTGTDSAVAYVIATEIDLSEECEANYVHYFVPNGASSAAGLATEADIWEIATETSIANLSSPQWTTESGGAVTIGTYGQWVKAAWPNGTQIPAGQYRVSVYNANGALGQWGAKDANTSYFVSGVGQNGIEQGPATAPSQADAQPATCYSGSCTGTSGGQPAFAYSGSDVYPSYTTGDAPAQQYWVDLEVTPG